MINETQWRTVILSDVCSLRVDTIAPQDALELPYVGLEHIDSRQPTLRRTGNAAHVRSAKHRYQRGDVLYGKLRPYLDKAVLATREGMCSTDILVLNHKEQIEADYLLNLVHSRPFIEHATKTTHGVNHPRTSWSGIGQFQFSIPPLAEQRAIAHVLATVQKAKEVRHRELTLERERKAALMEHLFTFGIDDEKREVEERTHGRSPSDWDVRLLDDCAFIQTGVAKGRKLSSAELITVPYLRVANVQNGYLDLSEMKEITIRKSELVRYSLAEGDVVLTEGGDFDKLGRGFVWGGQVAVCVHQNHIFAVRPNRKMVAPDFLAYLVQSPYGRSYFLSVAHKTTNLACINKTKLGRFPVLVPSLDEQQRIAHMLKACDAKISAQEHEVARLQELFDALLQELLSGKRNVMPLTSEGAEA